MAKLPTFTAQAAGGQLDARRASAADFGAGAGRATEGLGGQLQKTADTLKTIEENAEVRRVQLETARLRAEQSQAIEAARLAGTNYAEVEKSFSGRLAEMDQLAKTTKGRQAVALSQEMNRREFFGMINRAKQTRASEQATQEYTEFMEVVAAGLTADPANPEEYKADLKRFTESLIGLSPENKAMVYQKGAEQIDASSVERFIQIDPRFVLDTITSSDAWPNLPPAVRASATGRAKEKIFQEESRAKAAERWKVYERKQRGQAAYVEAMREILFPAEEDDRQQALETAAQHPDLDGPQVNSLYALNEALSKEANKPVRNNTVKARQLYERITADIGTERKIVTSAPLADAYIREEISRSDLDWLMRVLETDADPTGRSYWDSAKPFLFGVKKRIDKTTLQELDPEAAGLYAVFLKEFYTRYRTMREEGKNPRDLLDPTSKDYAGNWLSAQRRSGFVVLGEQARQMAAELTEKEIQAEFSRLVPLPVVTSPEELDKVKPGEMYMFQGRRYFKSSVPAGGEKASIAAPFLLESELSDFYDFAGGG